MPRRILFPLATLLLKIVACASQLSAQQFQNEEVLIFDKGDDGVVIVSLETGEWRSWLPGAYHATVSPDGQKIAYRQDGDILIADTDGQNPETLATGVSGNGELALSWSPQGDRIAYFKYDRSEAKTELVIMNLEGNVLATHEVYPTLQHQPSWSPDGSKILCITAGAGGSGSAICVLDVTSGSSTTIFQPLSTTGQSSWNHKSVSVAAWSPRGDKIAFDQETSKGSNSGPTTHSLDLMIINADGGSPMSVVNYPEGDTGSIDRITWSPDGSELAFSIVGYGHRGTYRVSAHGGTPLQVTDFIPGVTFSLTGITDGDFTVFQWTILNPGPSLEIDILPDNPNYGVDEDLEVQFTVTHRGDSPATYTFENGLFSRNPEPEEGETPIVLFEEFETPDPFVLSEEDPERTFSIQAMTAKPGVLNVLSNVLVQPTEGEAFTLEAEQAIVVSPISTEITITNKRHHWNSTEEAEWGERAKAINAQRRTDGLVPYLNLIEIEMIATNVSDEPIENLNIPDVRDILSYIQSTSEDPAVPLLPIRLFAPDGAEVDLTNPEDPTEVNDVSLQPGETATLAWVVEAYEIDVDVRKDPFDLEFTPLILGTQSGVELRSSGKETFSVRLRGPIVVNVTSDDRDFDPEDGVIDVDPDEEGEQISLRAAIEFANETPGLDRIEFDIPGEGVPTIKVGPPPEGTNVMATQPDGDLFLFPRDDSFGLNNFTISSALKATDPIEIDGSTQSAGFVQLSGELISAQIYKEEETAINCLEIVGGNSEIRGLVINRFPGIGLVIREKGGNTVAGNLIGSDSSGTQALGNGSSILTPLFLRTVEKSMPHFAANFLYIEPQNTRYYAGGILVNSSDNQIGGNIPKDANIIFGHGQLSTGQTSKGIANPYVSDVIVKGSAAAGNRIIGNNIGLDKHGFPNSGGLSAYQITPPDQAPAGILLGNGARDNVIRNNAVAMVTVVEATNTTISNNQIGPPEDYLDSYWHGSIRIYNSENTTISENFIFSPSSIKRYSTKGRWFYIFLNYGNDVLFIQDSRNVLVNRNTIEGGKVLTAFESSDITITGNIIETPRYSTNKDIQLPWIILVIDSNGVLVGGLSPTDANIITMGESARDRSHMVVRVESRTDMDPAGDIHEITFLGNSIIPHPNDILKVNAQILDLGNDGVDEIDYGDQDGKQNYPRVTQVTQEGGSIRFEGNLDSHLGGSSYHLDFYKTGSPLSSGHGGAPLSYVGRGIVETDVFGTGHFDIQISSNDVVEITDYFSATATRVDGGGTSEFSSNRRFTGNAVETVFGDRNGDGTNDSEQDHVASFAAPNGADTTIEVSAATSQTRDSSLPIAQSDFSTMDDANPTLENVLPETQASMGAPSNYDYSNGVITFEVPDLTNGASVSVKFILADDASPDTLWVLQSDDTWINTLPATFEGNQISLTLTDGGHGDRDGEANGRIVAALGPATALPPIPDMNFTITKQANSHTLSWPLPYSNALLEFSPDLSPDSWSSIDFFDAEPLGDHWQLTLPNPLPEFNEAGFYRLRYNTQSDPINQPTYHQWLRNQLETEYGITGGKWITGATESQARDTVYVDPDVTRKDFLVEGQPFIWGMNLKNAVVPPNNWNDFAFFRTQDTIATGDVLLLVAWVRGVDIGEGLPMVRHNFEMTTAPFTKIATHQVVTSGEWQQYLIPMEATFDLSESWYTIHMGFSVQEIEVGGVAVLNYGQDYSVEDLPRRNVP